MRKQKIYEINEINVIEEMNAVTVIDAEEEERTVMPDFLLT